MQNTPIYVRVQLEPVGSLICMKLSYRQLIPSVTANFRIRRAIMAYSVCTSTKDNTTKIIHIRGFHIMLSPIFTLKMLHKGIQPRNLPHQIFYVLMKTESSF